MLPESDLLSWRIRRWAAPATLTLSVAASIGAVHLTPHERASATPSTAQQKTPYQPPRKPRFELTTEPAAGSSGTKPAPWLQVASFQQDGSVRPVDSVRAPSPSAGKAREIIAGPNGTFVVSASRRRPCETRLYTFTLTGDGRVRKIEPLGRNTVPALVAGLAMSPDGRHLAYTTAPCTPAEPRATVTVLDTDSGDRRTWTTQTPAVIGEIIWAEDSRTLGYTISDVPPPATPPGNVPPSGRGIKNVTVHALDTNAPGTELRAGRILFRQPADASTVTGAVMNRDGRTGHGVLEKDEPPSTVFFSFSEGKPPHVIHTIRRDPNTDTFIGFVGDGTPNYACLNGIDSFDRMPDGTFPNLQGAISGCGTAYAF